MRYPGYYRGNLKVHGGEISTIQSFAGGNLVVRQGSFAEYQEQRHSHAGGPPGGFT